MNPLRTEGMDVALSGIFEESREYYLKRKRSLAGAILGIPKAALKTRKSGGEEGYYCYLHMRNGRKTTDTYLGKTDAMSLARLRQKFERRQKLLKEMAIARKSLKLLRVKAAMIDQEDFISPLRQVFQGFEKLGLWEAGLELVGSWCFRVYQNYLEVEPYPLRTLDVDIAIPFPYLGPEADIGDLLKNIGFEPDFRPNGAVFYVGFGMVIDLFSPDRGRGTKNGKIHIEKLHTYTLALRYLDILLDNNTMLQIRGVGRISVPSMPAFMLHKLLIAPLRPDKEKKAKDYLQIHSIAKRIFRDESLMDEAARILQSLPPRWSARIETSAMTMGDHLPADQQAGLTSMLLSRVSA
jgi:hypothetical protein